MGPSPFDQLHAAARGEPLVLGGVAVEPPEIDGGAVAGVFVARDIDRPPRFAVDLADEVDLPLGLGEAVVDEHRRADDVDVAVILVVAGRDVEGPETHPAFDSSPVLVVRYSTTGKPAASQSMMPPMSQT